MKIGIIVGSTRPGRRAPGVARWVERVASASHLDHSFEIVDIAEFGLPLLDEAIPAAFGQYRNQHTKAWSERIAAFDGYLFVVSEYNHSIPGALKNAIDFLYAEWHDKAAGLVGYGLHGGVRATEHLRLILAELKVADVRSVVMLALRSDFASFDADDLDAFAPSREHEEALVAVVDEVVSWSQALASVRGN